MATQYKPYFDIDWLSIETKRRQLRRLEEQQNQSRAHKLKLTPADGAPQPTVMNMTRDTTPHVEWCDIVFISSMSELAFLCVSVEKCYSKFPVRLYYQTAILSQSPPGDACGSCLHSCRKLVVGC